MKQKSPNRGIVLSLADAYALHRWLEYLLRDRKFFNPLDAMEAEQAFKVAFQRLDKKVCGHSMRSSEHFTEQEP